jgi:alpha-beta hydrolase superfamily lysophospholipase
VIAVALALVLAASSGDVRVSHRKVTTEDGAALALHRYLPPGDGLLAPPVLLIADLGFGRGLFDGLARYLAGEGRAVYLAELRGQGASDAGHSLRTVISLDLPAVARSIAAERAGPIDVVAHGYLGSLVLAAAGHELQVRKVVALNTPVLLESPTTLMESFLSEGGRFSALASSPEGFAEFDQLFTMGMRGDRRTVAAAASRARDLSRPVAAELLAWLRLGDLPLDDGTTVSTRLRAYDRPTLMLLALADAWAPSESCAPLREFSAAKVEVRMFTRVVEGDDFAHASLLIGARAPQFVFPEIVRFLK